MVCFFAKSVIFYIEKRNLRKNVKTGAERINPAILKSQDML